MSPDDPRHGTPAGRHVHRRDHEPTCDRCLKAAARYEQELQLDHLNGRPRSIPATGTRRRIQALVALGHDFARIGEALGVTQAAANAIAHRTNPTVYATTAARVASLYEAWSMRLPAGSTPRDRRAATYARTVAARNGWLPPLAWDDIDHDTRPAAAANTRPRHAVDPVVVERVLAGDLVPTSIAEKREIVARWPTTGRPYADLADLTGWKVERYHQTDTEEAA